MLLILLVNMEVLSSHSPSSNDPFDFNRARISPYLSAPSSPKRFGQFYYLSAPSSPSKDFDLAAHDDDAFAFFVTGESKSPRSAAELFDGGKIKPLSEDDSSESAKSPLLPAKRSSIAQGKKAIREAFSTRKKKEEGDLSEEEQETRGRDRTASSSRVTRSLSPCNRISHYTWDEERNQSQSNKADSLSKTSRRWRLTDFLLFRSASEGRGSSKDPLRKFPTFYKKPEDPKASNPGPKTRRKEPLSAHELHYARKKAETEDLKKRTFLPYKQGILGRLAGFGSK